MKRFLRCVRIRLVPVALLFALASAVQADDWTVSVQNFEFVPAYLEINEGDTVVFQWTSGFHTVTSVDGFWDSDVQRAPYSYEVTFIDAGDYYYYCDLHGCPCGSGMFGLISVLCPAK